MARYETNIFDLSSTYILSPTPEIQFDKAFGIGSMITDDQVTKPDCLASNVRLNALCIYGPNISDWLGPNVGWSSFDQNGL